VRVASHASGNRVAFSLPSDQPSNFVNDMDEPRHVVRLRHSQLEASVRNDWAALSAEIRAEELSDKACESLRLALEQDAIDSDESEYLKDNKAA
jgi:hypothetical protein